MPTLFPLAHYGRIGKVRPYVHINRNFWHGQVKAHANQPGYSPLELAKLYSFPFGNGKGLKIGGLAMANGGSCGIDQKKLTEYLTNLGIKNPPELIWHDTDGRTPNIDGGSNSPSVETYLDWCLVMALLPLAEHHCFACQNSSGGIKDMAQAAMEEGCEFFGCSYGAPERYWSDSEAADTEGVFAAATSRGMWIFCASGDNDAGDGLPGRHVDMPASFQNAIGVGGTRLLSDGTESVWNTAPGEGTGGGMSHLVPLPDWQKASDGSPLWGMRGGFARPPAHIPQPMFLRGVPDLAADADPETGIQIVGGTVGGTSAGPWQWIGLLGRILAGTSTGPGVPLPTDFKSWLYQVPQGVFRAITEGNNGAWWAVGQPGGSAFGGKAAESWNACCGLGSPNGANILSALQGASSPKGKSGAVLSPPPSQKPSERKANKDGEKAPEEEHHHHPAKEESAKS